MLSACYPVVWQLRLLLQQRTIHLIAGVTLALALGLTTVQPRGVATGVRVDGVEVTGLSRAELRALVMRRAADRLAVPIQVTAGERVWSVSPRSLGAVAMADRAIGRAWLVGRELSLVRRAASWLVRDRSIPMEFSVPESSGRKLAQSLARQPKPARLVFGETGRPVLRPAEAGIGLSPAEAASQLAQSLSAGQDRLVLLARAIPWTDGTTTAGSDGSGVGPEHAIDIHGIEAMRARFVTPITTRSRNARTNMRVAIERLDGTMIPDGMEFSFNTWIGKRTSSKGFMSAPILINAKGSQGIGGGICQVSSTLHVAALLANLRILQRHNHSRPSRYIRPGWDAAVYWPRRDMRFRNTSGGPIGLHLAMLRGHVVVEVWGRPMAERVALSDRASTGSGRLNVELYRTVESGTDAVASVRRQLVARSTYIIRSGYRMPATRPSPALQRAVRAGTA